MSEYSIRSLIPSVLTAVDRYVAVDTEALVELRRSRTEPPLPLGLTNNRKSLEILTIKAFLIY